MEIERSVEVPRRFLGIGKSVSRGPETLFTHGASSRHGDAFPVSHIAQRSVRHIVLRKERVGRKERHDFRCPLDLKSGPLRRSWNES